MVGVIADEVECRPAAEGGQDPLKIGKRGAAETGEDQLVAMAVGGAEDPILGFEQPRVRAGARRARPEARVIGLEPALVAIDAPAEVGQEAA